MSATVRSTPPSSRSVRAHPRDADDHAQLAVRRIGILAVAAFVLALLAGPFAGIVLCVAGLATFAAYAAAHPYRGY